MRCGECSAQSGGAAAESRADEPREKRYDDDHDDDDDDDVSDNLAQTKYQKLSRTRQCNESYERTDFKKTFSRHGPDGGDGPRRFFVSITCPPSFIRKLSQKLRSSRSSPTEKEPAGIRDSCAGAVPHSHPSSFTHKMERQARRSGLSAKTAVRVVQRCPIATVTNACGGPGSRCPEAWFGTQAPTSCRVSLPYWQWNG